jgi:type II secretory pathway component PulF
MTHLESKGIPAEVGRALKQDVTEGKSLSDAMARQPIVFSDMFINMVRAGEQSGALVEVLRRVADHYERFAEVQSKFISALIYPAIVVCVGIVIIMVFMTFMLPKFMEIFKGLNVTLPTSTRMLMTIGDFFGRGSTWLVIGLLAVVVTILFLRFKSSEGGARRIDGWKMSAPVVGRVVRLNLFGQFARTLATLLQNGVPVLTALKITEEVIPNRIIKEAISRTRQEVTDGKTLAQPLARSRVFPQLMIDLVKIGEETGDVPGALQNVAGTFESELNIALRVMTNLIEPIMIIVMAVGVGGLLFSILSAMFAITSSIGQQR